MYRQRIFTWVEVFEDEDTVVVVVGGLVVLVSNVTSHMAVTFGTDDIA